jgi:hypothetical protein
MGELGAGNNQGGNGGCDGADAVDQQFLFPMRPFLDEPAFHHPGLGDREGQEDAHGIQGNQRMSVAVEQDDQQAGEDAENDDAVREDEPVSHHGHLVRHVAVAGPGSRLGAGIR